MILEKTSCFVYSQADLFQKVIHSQEPETAVIEQSVERIEINKKDLRSKSVLYEALASDRRKHLEKLYSIKKVDRGAWRKLDSSSQTDSCSCTHSTTYSSNESKKKLEYLLGIECGDEDEATLPTRPDLEQIVYEEPADEDYTGTTEAMRQAQKYLRTHKIFQFYQFLITHLLSACPGEWNTWNWFKLFFFTNILTKNDRFRVLENPIEFLVDLLDRCLIYRAGFCPPPLLYEKKHLGKLFLIFNHSSVGQKLK